MWKPVKEILVSEQPDNKQQLDSFRAKDDDSGCLVLLTNCPNSAQWLSGEGSVLKRVSELLPQNGSVRSVRVQLEEIAPQQVKAASKPAPAAPAKRTGLSVKYSFAHFVSGSSNEIAYGTALRLATEPGEHDELSPLYIHGAVGLGKTHLAHAIGLEFLRRQPEARIRLLSGEQFMREVQRDFTSGSVEKFRKRFRELDLLILDDIQLIGRESEQTQKQFVSLFNYMTEQQRPMVITSDQPAARLRKNMPPRMVSRLAMGIDVTVHPPDFDTRFGILMRHAESYDRTLPDDTARVLAEALRSNCRELLGGLRKVFNIARVNKQTPMASIAKKVVAEISMRPAQIDAETVLDAVCKHARIRRHELQSKRRIKVIAQARHIAMYLCREVTQMSLPAIGELFACHHSTVLHACRKVEGLMHNQPEVSISVSQIREDLGA